MSFLVMKFGGTSVGDSARIRQSAGLVREALARDQVVVVVSAMAGITDAILKTARQAAAGKRSAMESQLAALETRHRQTIAELLHDAEIRAAVLRAFEEQRRELREFCDALVMLRSLTPQVLDVALSMGERMLANIFAACLRESGVQAEYVDSAQVLVTDETFGDAAPDMKATRRLCRERLLPMVQERRVPVVTGYRGATAAGQPTTLGRGGSDFSATILGAALECDEIWIWTDVDGVMSADPRICPGAETLAEITFAEAIELSYYGAKVIHRKAILPAMEARIPVWIKNSFQPSQAGTRIVSSVPKNGHAVKAVTAVTDACLFNISTRQGAHFEDLFGRLFLDLGHERLDVLFSTHSSSENALGLVFRKQDAERALEAIHRAFRTELKHGVLAPPVVQPDVAVIAVLGETMKGKCGVLARLFSAVARCGVSVIAVAQGASELNICFAVPAVSAAKVVSAVHDEFIPVREEAREVSA